MEKTAKGETYFIIQSETLEEFAGPLSKSEADELMSSRYKKMNSSGLVETCSNSAFQKKVEERVAQSFALEQNQKSTTKRSLKLG